MWMLCQLKVSYIVTSCFLTGLKACGGRKQMQVKESRNGESWKKSMLTLWLKLSGWIKSSMTLDILCKWCFVIMGRILFCLHVCVATWGAPAGWADSLCWGRGNEERGVTAHQWTTPAWHRHCHAYRLRLQRRAAVASRGGAGRAASSRTQGTVLLDKAALVKVIQKCMFSLL